MVRVPGSHIYIRGDSDSVVSIVGRIVRRIVIGDGNGAVGMIGNARKVPAQWSGLPVAEEWLGFVRLKGVRGPVPESRPVRPETGS